MAWKILGGSTSSSPSAQTGPRISASSQNIHCWPLSETGYRARWIPGLHTALLMLLFILRRNIYCSVMSFLHDNQPLYYLHPAPGQPSSIPCTLLHFICIAPLFPFLPLCHTLIIYFNCCLGSRGAYRDLRHGDRDVFGLDGELHALPQVGGEALRLVRPLAAVLARASAGGQNAVSRQQTGCETPCCGTACPVRDFICSRLD